MVEVGSVITARVTRVEPYGIFLKHGEEIVAVLTPEVSWSNTRDPREWVRVGDDFDIRVLRYNYEKREIVGSIRRLHPEENPYRELSRLEPGEVLRGKVRGLYGDGVTVELPNGAWGRIPKQQLRTEYKAGETVEVTIAALEVDEGILSLQPAYRDARPVSPAAGATAANRR